jgi:hypothetical protein
VHGHTGTKLPGRSSRPAVRASLNTKTAAQLEAIEPRMIDIIMKSFRVEFYAPWLIYIAIEIALEF